MTPNLVAICLKCPQRSPPPYSGKCLCTVDGRDILEHARAHDCPEVRFPVRGAGDVVARALARTGVAPVAKAVIRAVTGKPCQCPEEQARLNARFPAK